MNFQKDIIRLLGEGQQLSVSDKLLARQVITTFETEYEQATGTKPQPLFGTIYLIAPRLQELGFVLPRVDNWRKEDESRISELISKR